MKKIVALGLFFVAPFLSASTIVFSSSIDQLQTMQDDLAGRYLLGMNIDASATANWNDGAGFAPVGDNSTSDDDSRFTGTFDGLGHTVSELTISRPATDDVGLFGYVGSGGTVRHIGLLGGSIKGRNYVGGLVGTNSGTIENVYATGAVSGDGSEVGGLVGRSESGSITNAYATGAVSGNDYVGGLIGRNNKGPIENAYATGAVSGHSFVGGLMGDNFNGATKNVYATGKVSGNDKVGGLVGSNLLGTIENAYATGAVSGNSSVGGLVGVNGTIAHAYYATTDSDGKTINSEESYNTEGEGKSLAALQTLATFADWEGDIDDAGGTGTVWRLYEGFTTPLLRHFLTDITVTANDTIVYNGAATGTSAYTTSVLDASLDGSLNYTTSSKNVGTYTTDGDTNMLTLGGLYSGQQGYDILSD